MCDLPLELRASHKNHASMLGLENPFTVGYKAISSTGGIDGTKESTVVISTDEKLYDLLVNFELNLLLLIRRLMKEIRDHNIDEMIDMVRLVAIEVQAQKDYYMKKYATNLEKTIINLLRYIRQNMTGEFVDNAINHINLFHQKILSGSRFTSAMQFTNEAVTEVEIVTYIVESVIIPNGNIVYQIQDQVQPVLTFAEGKTYILDWSRVANRPLLFSTQREGTNIEHNNEYLDNVEISIAAKTTTILPTEITPRKLYYYASNHQGMGGEIDVIKEDNGGCGCK